MCTCTVYMYISNLKSSGKTLVTCTPCNTKSVLTTIAKTTVLIANTMDRKQTLYPEQQLCTHTGTVNYMQLYCEAVN